MGLTEEQIREAMRIAGSRGGKTTSALYGHAHYVAAGHTGGQKVKALIELGKKSLEAEEAKEESVTTG